MLGKEKKKREEKKTYTSHSSAPPRLLTDVNLFLNACHHGSTGNWHFTFYIHLKMVPIYGLNNQLTI